MARSLNMYIINIFAQQTTQGLTLLISSSTLCAGSKPNLSRAESGARPCTDFARVWREGADRLGGGLEDPRVRASIGMAVALGFSRDDHGILSLSATD